MLLFLKISWKANVFLAVSASNCGCLISFGDSFPGENTWVSAAMHNLYQLSVEHLCSQTDVGLHSGSALLAESFWLI